MNEVISKFSSYNIFNYLVPGGAFCLLLDGRGLIDLDDLDVAARLIFFYVVGMAISRAGSLLIDPALKRAGMISRSKFTDYIRAAASDDTIPVLLETSNTYRTMTAACFLAIAFYAFSMLVPHTWLRHDAIGCVVLAMIGVLFTVSYVKQNKAVTRRVRGNICVEAEDRTRASNLSGVGNHLTPRIRSSSAPAIVCDHYRSMRTHF